MKLPQFILPIWAFLISSGIYAQKRDTVQIQQMLDTNGYLLKTAPAKAIPLAQEIYKYSVEANFEYGQIQSLLDIANCYSYLRQFGKAIEASSNAESLAVKINDNYALTDALRLKALAYSSLGYHSAARKTNKKNLDATFNIKNSDFAYCQRGLSYEASATILNNEKAKLDSIIYYDRKSISVYLKIMDGSGPALLTSGYTNLASDFLALKNLDSAEYYYRKAMKLAESLDKDHDKIQILCDLGQIYQAKNQNTIAIDYFKDAIDAARTFKDPYALKDIYQHISKSYEGIGDYKSAIINIKSYTVLNDSLLNSEKRELITPMKQIIKDNESDFKETSQNLYRIISISAIFIVICLYGGTIFYRKFKNEKLTAKQISSLLEEKMGQLNTIQEAKNENIDEVILKDVIKMAINGEASFIIKFQELYPKFRGDLIKIAPSLIASELKFSAFIKLDFSTKEIARYTISSIRAVEAKKYRLRKKLNIPADVDTNVWMSKV